HRQQQRSEPKQPTNTRELPSGATGWSAAMTTAGEVYYVNHINETTSWERPKPVPATAVPAAPAPAPA
ncbi:unnamed protein product, partial [Hapterophycus canaliculatus]